jgi:hypothetical protein
VQITLLTLVLVSRLNILVMSLKAQPQTVTIKTVKINLN